MCQISNTINKVILIQLMSCQVLNFIFITLCRIFTSGVEYKQYKRLQQLEVNMPGQKGQVEVAIILKFAFLLGGTVQAAVEFMNKGKAEGPFCFRILFAFLFLCFDTSFELNLFESEQCLP